MFNKFGLSNSLAHEVENVIRVAQENNFVLPSVYQGSYSAIARRQESELLPVLRKHHFSFYAYSPLSSGFLAKTRDDIAAGKGRWDSGSASGQINLAILDKPSTLRVGCMDIHIREVANSESRSSIPMDHISFGAGWSAR